MAPMICKELQAMLIQNKWEFISTDVPGERVMPKKGYKGPHIITPNRITMYYNYDPNGDGSEHRKYVTILMKHLLEMSYKKLTELDKERKVIVSALQKIVEIPQYTAKKCRSQKCDVCPPGHIHASQDAYSILCMEKKMDSNWCIKSDNYDGIITCPKCMEIMVQRKMDEEQ
jgi:hypothetical protein